MSKKSVPVQKGPIAMSQQETYRFCTRAQKEMEDTQHAMLKRHGQTMDLHEPKK